MNVQFIGSDRAAFPAAASSGNVDMVLDEESPLLAYGGATWAVDLYDPYYGQRTRYCQTNGGWVQLTVPVGYARIRFQGIREPNGGAFDVLVNNVVRFSGDMAAPALVPAQTYYDSHVDTPALALQAGDVVRLVKTGGPTVYCDQVVLSAA